MIYLKSCPEPFGIDAAQLDPGSCRLSPNASIDDRKVSPIEEGFSRIAQAGRSTKRADEARVRLQSLTPRERDVLEGLVRGHPNKTIAYDLDISPRTVEIHRANLMSKLEVASLSEALRIAFAAGLDEQRAE